jgi:enoyl-CoA hydratase/carnithine racemase
MPRFRLHDDEIVFDDGGMNLLSSDALRELGAVVAGLRAAVGESSRSGSPPLTFRSGRPHIFAAGADMAEMQHFSAAEAEAFARLGQETFDAVERLPRVTVALIDGDCFGGALDLVLAFDLRYATSRSRFAHPGARLGIVTGFGGTSRWRKVLDRPAARRLFLNNEVLSADDALALGLIDRIGESFDDELARLSALDPATTRYVKELTRVGERLSREQLKVMAERLGQIYFESFDRHSEGSEQSPPQDERTSRAGFPLRSE